jgi:hypothetical protein
MSKLWPNTVIPKMEVPAEYLFSDFHLPAFADLMST